MKRKTNLFYLTGDDSKFITFSNYGESMTGNFLATDWKLFPSKFICMYIKFLDVNADTDSYTYEERKEKLIKYLASYYEKDIQGSCGGDNATGERAEEGGENKGGTETSGSSE